MKPLEGEEVNECVLSAFHILLTAVALLYLSQPAPHKKLKEEWGQKQTFRNLVLEVYDIEQ